MKKFILLAMIAVAVAMNVQAAPSTTTHLKIAPDTYKNNVNQAPRKHHHHKHHRKPHHPVHHHA